MLNRRNIKAHWLLVLFLLVSTALKGGDFEYSTNADNTLTITWYTGPGGNVVIPSNIEGQTVTIIGSRAFAGHFWDPNTILTNVTIPDSVIRIEGYAFAYNIRLEGVLIGNSVANIGNYSFESCYSLTNLTIPNSVTNIESEAFGFSGLTNVWLGKGVISLGSSVFNGCFSLESISVDAENSVYMSLDGVLIDKSQTMLLRYPQNKSGGSYTIPESITSIGYHAFDDCRHLTSVIIPNSVTSIYNSAFSINDSLRSVIIGNGVESIGESAFAYCHSLSDVTIGAGVTSIGRSAFEGTDLTNVTIPNSVINIGVWAFAHCDSLSDVTVGAGVTSIERSAFLSADQLMGVYFLGNLPNIGSNVFSGDDIATVYYLPGTAGWGWTFGGRPAMPWWDGPQISANGAREDLALNSGEPVRITVATADSNIADASLDWWIIARAGSAWYYRNNAGQWTQYDGSTLNCHPAYQGRLFNLPATEVLNATGLEPGSYTFWFAIDYPMDGILNLGGYILIDSVNVSVQ